LNKNLEFYKNLFFIQKKSFPNTFSSDPELFNSTLDLLRKEGLGLTRCYKNTGKYKYAFNALQIATFPRDYKPPKDTYSLRENLTF